MPVLDGGVRIRPISILRTKENGYREMTTPTEAVWSASALVSRGFSLPPFFTLSIKAPSRDRHSYFSCRYRQRCSPASCNASSPPPPGRVFPVLPTFWSFPEACKGYTKPVLLTSTSPSCLFQAVPRCLSKGILALEILSKLSLSTL